MIPLDTPKGIPTILVLFDVISAGVPALTEIDVLDQRSLTPCTVSNWLIKWTLVDEGDTSYAMGVSQIPLTKFEGHLYAQYSILVLTCFNSQQVIKLSRQFLHRSSEKLYNLLRKAHPEDTTQETQKKLEEISCSCDPSQRNQARPTLSKVSFGTENILFNEEVVIDIMYLDEKPVLHMLDAQTQFSAARRIADVSTTNIWKCTIQCWIIIYTGTPYKIKVDQGSAFGNNLISVVKTSNIDVVRTGIVSHSSMVIGERYHEPLRKTFRKLRISSPGMDPSMLLAISVYAMKTTLGPEGLLPLVGVLG